MSTVRARIMAALAKPIADDDQSVHSETFDPWEDVIEGIYGSYASESDELMIGALKAVRDNRTFEFIKERGFVGEFALYVLAGHGLTEYGTSPRGGWPDPVVADLWDALIAKWEAHAVMMWGTNWNESE